MVKRFEPARPAVARRTGPTRRWRADWPEPGAVIGLLAVVNGAMLGSESALLTVRRARFVPEAQLASAGG
jgi:hypothetical protein